MERRAIQLGLRGKTLETYAREWILSIEDVSEFVRAQAANITAMRLSELVMPREDVYPVADREVAGRLGTVIHDS